VAGGAVAWLSLDAGDNDPARFWRHAVAAIDRRPGVAEQLLPLLGPPAPPSFEGLVTALINELAARPDRVLLVLDDYHLVEAQPVHASLLFLLEHLPPGLQLVPASRIDPPLGLVRLRARGQLAELRATEPRFTSEEAGAVLREAVGHGLPDAAVAALATRTEGWAAGLQLAGLSLRGQADVAGFVATFSGSHRYVLDYLAEEVLERQPDAIREFLLETSGARAAVGQALRRGHRPRRRPAPPGCERHGLADDAMRHALAAGDATWRPGWSRSTPTRSGCAVKGRPCAGGSRRFPPSWSSPGHGCCWRRRSWPASTPRGGGG
jgi:ATP/maltotriose-dependent transcriptional regulator MalT